jgi:CheY-like chemotaxis protein
MEKPILLVEDDRVDAMTVKRALRDIQFDDALYHVENGEEALAFLRDPDKPRPAIILLDLNMPRMNGVEFLRVAKEDAKLRQIPVIILTTSVEDQDRISSFDLSVAGYMVKPVDYAQFVEIMRTVNDYWEKSELPS